MAQLYQPAPSVLFPVGDVFFDRDRPPTCMGDDQQAGRNGRRKGLYLVLGSLGLLVGATVLGVGLTSGHVDGSVSAVTRINMAPSSTAPPDAAIAADVSLLKTNQVAAKAVADGHLDITPKALSSHYKGASVGDSIVQITTTSSTYPLAAEYANALAKAFLAVQANVQGQTLRLQIAEYQGDLAVLNQQVSNLTAQIGALTPAAPTQPTAQASARIQNLTNQRASDIQQANTLTTEINTDQANLTILTSGNVVVDAAIPG